MHSGYGPFAGGIGGVKALRLCVRADNNIILLQKLFGRGWKATCNIMLYDNARNNDNGRGYASFAHTV